MEAVHAGWRDPALAATLYSLILIGTAFLMARREASRGASDVDAANPDDGPATPSLLRGTPVALCIVAILLPMARIVGTTATGDLMLLGGTIVAAGAALVHLMRGQQAGSSIGSTSNRRVIGRGAERRTTRLSLLNDPYAAPTVGASDRRTPGGPGEAAEPDDEPAAGPHSTGHDATGLHSTGHDSIGLDSTGHDASATDTGGDAPCDEAATPTGQASRTLHEVADVVGDYAHRLGIAPDPGVHPLSLPADQRSASGTDPGANP